MPKHLIAVKGPLKGQAIILEGKKEYSIGRDSEMVDFILEDKMTSRKHAILYEKEDGIWIKDLSQTNPILINDKNILQPYLLKENDEIKIGQNTFIFSEKDLPEKYTLTPENIKKEGFEEEKTYFLEEEKKPIKKKTKKTAKKKKSVIKEEDIYDTIFEEKESVFDMSYEYNFFLKVIKGPNAGAEFGMEKNTNYIVGKDPNAADIIFNDLSVSKMHAKISIEEDQVFIEDLGSKNGVLVNGKRIDSKQKITSQDTISLGTSCFLVLDQKALSETIYSPIEEIEEKKEVAIEEEKEWKKEKISSKYIIGASSLVLVVLMIFLSFFSLIKGKKIDIVKKDPVKEIEDVIGKFKNVQFSYNPANKKIFLSGHILFKINQKELFYDLKSMNFIKDIENNVVIDELIWKNTNDILSKNNAWKGVFLTSTKAGHFLLKGYVISQKDKENLIDYLNSHFSYADKLQENIVVENILKEEIASLLITKNLTNLSFQITDGSLVLAGRYDKKRKDAFEKLLEDLKKIEGIKSIKNLAIETTKSAASIDLTSKYKISGFANTDDKTMVVINNKIISEGDILDNMKVVKIKKNIIYLEKDGLKYKINYK